MRKFTSSFTLGVVLGTVVATAWANYVPSASKSAPVVAAAPMDPVEMMISAQNLPIQGHIDAH
jgi:hypothetical protein